jgi:hypothetical protein
MHTNHTSCAFVCCSCLQSLLKDDFSKAQLSKKMARRCKSCVEGAGGRATAQLGPRPAADAATATSTVTQLPKRGHAICQPGSKLEPEPESAPPAPEFGLSSALGPQPQPAPDCLAVGECVKIHGLDGAPQHNGKLGQVISYSAETGRYRIQVQGAYEHAKPLGIKPCNLMSIERFPAPASPGDVGKSPPRTVTKQLRHVQRLAHSLSPSQREQLGNAEAISLHPIKFAADRSFHFGFAAQLPRRQSDIDQPFRQPVPPNIIGSSDAAQRAWMETQGQYPLAAMPWSRQMDCWTAIDWGWFIALLISDASDVLRPVCSGGVMASCDGGSIRRCRESSG